MASQLRRIATTAALALVVAIATPVFVHRRDFDAAVARWTQNQSADNTAGLASERTKTRRLRVRVEAAVGFGVFVGLNAGLLLKDRLRRQSN